MDTETPAPQPERTVEEIVRAELEGLRDVVDGIEGTLVASSDGLLVAHDFPGEEPVQVAALTSVLSGLARNTVDVTGRGRLLDASVRGSGGYFAVYAVGETAVLAVVGSEDVNLALLHLRTRPVVARLAPLADRFARFFDGRPADQR